MRRTEVKVLKDSSTHHGDVSMWNSQVVSLCGKSFPDKAYREMLIYGGFNCPDCKRAKRLTKHS